VALDRSSPRDKSIRPDHMSIPRARIVADFGASRGNLSTTDPSLLLIVRLALTLSALIILLAPTSAMATLGEPVQSIAADQRALGGRLRMLSQQQPSTGEQGLHEQPSSPSNLAYTVEQISTPDGVTVNEYLSPNRTVFAVSWRGPRPPDLSQLLGSYFPEYQAAAAAPPEQHHRLLLQTENLVVETSGHMRDLRGRAYIPALLPPGVKADEIQ
jgi:Protein of unknown function (DUF2844)